MSTGFQIKSVSNPKNGVTVSVVLDGQPAGTPTFALCRTPDVARAAAASATLSGGVWAVTVPHPSLWYVWATDTNGTTAPGAVYAGLSDNPELDLCGQALADILTANKPALDIALASSLQGATLKQIVYGGAAAITAFPAILVTKPVVTSEYIGMPWVREMTYQLEIMFTILHQDSAPLLKAATRFLGRVTEILNQPDYEGIRLESGTRLAFCQCREGESDEQQLEENKWASVGSLVWTAKSLLQDAGQTPGS